MARKSVSPLSTMLVCTLFSLQGCGGGDTGTAPANPAPAPPAGVGVSGGTVSGPQGSSVVVPAGALGANTDIRIELSSAGAPPLPAGYTGVGAMFALLPHGTSFASPVKLTLPFDTALVPAGASPALMKTNPQGEWVTVQDAAFGSGAVTANISSFSFARIVIPPVVRNEPTRTWSFGAFPGNGGAEIDFGGGTQVGGLFEEFVDFGPGFAGWNLIGLTQSIPADGRARGHVFGTANGVTYGAYAEAPYATMGGSEPVGSASRLGQTQSFVKRSENATLRFTFTQVVLAGGDFNLFAPSVGIANTNLIAQIFIDVRAYTTNRTFFHTAGGAILAGHRRQWMHDYWNYPFARTPLWSNTSFTMTGEDITDANFAHCAGDSGTLQLREPHTYVLDLSSIEVGEEFTLHSEISASANNRRGGGAFGDCEGSAIVAFLRDPLEAGGASVEFTGLEPTNRPVTTPPPDEAEPESCASGVTSPDAGVLQFSAGSFSVDEFAGAVPSIVVTRTGGNQGAVSVNFSTGDGSAGTDDYESVQGTVLFADGDDARRVIEVPITGDARVEANETIDLALSNPGGCAALGPQSTAQLIIVDDDLPPPTGLPGALDRSFDSDGKATLRAFGGDRSAMALQPDGKVIMVGGTFVDFVLARFNEDGSVDSTFDGDGRVMTNIAAGEQEEALAVAVQPDAKIVVAGYTGTTSARNVIALARYNSDGSLDTTFGAGGKLVSSVPGVAYAIAIQADGRIVVAGETPRPDDDDFSDFVVARFNPGGTLDPDFGTAGRVVKDIGGLPNTARNIVIQPDGAILVSGEAIGTFAGSNHTDLVRLDREGGLDETFGAGGVLALPAVRVGEGLALQAGKLILAGSVDTGGGTVVRSQFSVHRLNADGSADASFGEAGIATVEFTDRGDMGLAVAVQADGKIVVAGRSSLTTNSDFALARLLANGALDTSFANAGKLTVDFFGFNDIAESVAIRSDGKVVLGGLARDSVDGYGVARVDR